MARILSVRCVVLAKLIVAALPDLLISTCRYYPACRRSSRLARRQRYRPRQQPQARRAAHAASGRLVSSACGVPHVVALKISNTTTVAIIVKATPPIWDDSDSFRIIRSLFHRAYGCFAIKMLLL